MLRFDKLAALLAMRWLADSIYELIASSMRVFVTRRAGSFILRHAKDKYCAAIRLLSFGSSAAISLLRARGARVYAAIMPRGRHFTPLCQPSVAPSLRVTPFINYFITRAYAEARCRLCDASPCFTIASKHAMPRHY